MAWWPCMLFFCLILFCFLGYYWLFLWSLTRKDSRLLFSLSLVRGTHRTDWRDPEEDALCLWHCLWLIKINSAAHRDLLRGALWSAAHKATSCLCRFCGWHIQFIQAQTIFSCFCLQFYISKTTCFSSLVTRQLYAGCFFHLSSQHTPCTESMICRHYWIYFHDISCLQAKSSRNNSFLLEQGRFFFSSSDCNLIPFTFTFTEN